MMKHIFNKRVPSFVHKVFFALIFKCNNFGKTFIHESKFI